MTPWRGDTTLERMSDPSHPGSAQAYFDEIEAGLLLLDASLEPVWSNAFYRAKVDPGLSMCEMHCFTGLSPGEERCQDCLPPQVLRTGRTLETLRSVRDETGRMHFFRVVLTPAGTGVAVLLFPLPPGEGGPSNPWRERFLLSAIRNSNDAVFALDRQHTVRFWNRGAESLFGWTIEEAVGHTLDHLFPPDSPDAVEVFTPADPTRAFAHRELALVSRSRGEIWVDVSRTPLLDGSGQPNGYSFVVRDVTERRQAAQQMALTERMTAVGNMAAALAHEIGTPLGVISGNAEVLLLDLADGKARAEDLEVILREAERIGGLVRDLLEFARPEAPEMEDLRLGLVLERVERLVHHSARKQNTTLELAVDDDLPPVLGDANQLEQVTLNLVMNALQALASGGGRIEIGARAGRHGGSDGICLTVVDDGPGIEPDALGRIFHPFFTTKQNGTGLGLAVCQRIVEEHHGHLTARNGEERGAAFEVWLPVPPPEAPNP